MQWIVYGVCNGEIVTLLCGELFMVSVTMEYSALLCVVSCSKLLQFRHKARM